MARNKTRAKTYGLITDKDDTSRLDHFRLSWFQERNTILIRSDLTGIEFGINADTLIEFINQNKPDIFEPF